MRLLCTFIFFKSVTVCVCWLNLSWFYFSILTLNRSWAKWPLTFFFVYLDCWSFFAKEILWKPYPTNILQDHRSHLNVTVWCVYLPSQRCEACGKGDPTAQKRPSAASLLHIGALTQTPRSEWAACRSSAGGEGRSSGGWFWNCEGGEKKGKPSFVWEVLQSCGCRYTAHLRRLELGGLLLHPPIIFTSFLSLHYILTLFTT